MPTYVAATTLSQWAEVPEPPRRSLQCRVARRGGLHRRPGKLDRQGASRHDRHVANDDQRVGKQGLELSPFISIGCPGFSIVNIKSSNLPRVLNDTVTTIGDMRHRAVAADPHHDLSTWDAIEVRAFVSVLL